MKTLTEFSQVALRRAAEAHKAALAGGLEGDALAEALQSQLAIPAERVPRVLEAIEIVGDSLDKVSVVRVFQGEAGPQGSTAKGEFHYVVNRISSPKGAGAQVRDERSDGKGGRGGDRRGGGGDRPRNDKPRGLGSLKAGAAKDDGGRGERVNFAEIPRAGMGWQWTRAPREAGDARPGRGGNKRGAPGRRPGGGPGGNRGPGGGGPGGSRGPRMERRDGRAPALATDTATATPPASTTQE